VELRTIVRLRTRQHLAEHEQKKIILVVD